MHRLALVIVALVISCGIAAAQSNPPYLCPTLSIEGPNRILKPGETAKFTAKVVAHGPELQIKYNWHVSYGKVLSGQGTPTIEVEKPPSGSLTATVEIRGTPDDSHCPLVHSETAHWDAPAECPTISAVGPAGIPRPGDKVPFRVDVGEKGKDYNLKYHWMTSTGEIVSGQGAVSIEVKFEGGMNLTVTVEVIGLPKDCGATASESIPWESPIEAVRVGVIQLHETGVFEKKLKEFSDELVSNPNNQGHIFIGSRPDSKTSELEARETKLLELLAKLMGRSYDRSRLTLVRSGGKTDLIELWRIPPGADNPKCEECNPAACPTISVVGPAGIVQRGEKFVFTGAVEGDAPNNVSFQWEVSGGKIAEGQGTLKISVDADWSLAGSSITATLNVLGLPEKCPKSASDAGGVMTHHTPVLIDEFGRLANDAIETRLKKFYVELANNPNSQGYIILYGSEKEMTARERLIVKSVNFRNFDRSRITIIRGGPHPNGTVYTKLYRVPPGAENPAP